jgi:uncharacterized membrane protein
VNRVAAHFRHHLRFYAAAVAGLATFFVSRLLGFAYAPVLAGDVFFLLFLLLCLFLLAERPAQLARRAESEDEGIGIVVLVTLAAISFFCETVFVALNGKHAAGLLPLILAGIGAPLGWLVLHVVMAFHYANLHYFDDPETLADDERDLDFPGCAQPGPWDFLYFSLVIGMTCQVSDVRVKTTAMRRAVLGHGLASFVFNTVFIAMAVNAAVAMAA